MTLALKKKSYHSIHHLFNSYQNASLDKKYCLQQINSLRKLQSGELPIFCSFLNQLGFSGKFSLYLPENPQEEYAHILFHQGKIKLVHHAYSNEKNLLLGKMFVAHGYLHGDDLKDFLEEEKFENKNQGKKRVRIGNKLIAKNLLSPHALENVLMEQIHRHLLSLSEKEFFHFSIEPKSDGCNLSLSSHKDNLETIEGEREHVGQNSIFLSDVRFNFCLHNWIISKISNNWLKVFYDFYKDKKILFKLNDDDNPSAPSLDKLYLMNFFIKSVLPIKDLNEKEGSFYLKHMLYEIKDQGIEENLFYRALYFAVLKGIVYFSSQGDSEKGEEKQYISFLDNLHRSMQGQSPIELFYIMGGKVKMNRKEIHQIYTSFLKKINPKEEDLSIKQQQSYEQILSWAFQGREAALECDPEKKNSQENAYNILSFDSVRQLKVQKKIQEAHNLLIEFHTEKAFNLLESFQDSIQKYKNLSVYMLWIQLQRFTRNESKMSKSERINALKSLDESFHSLPLEEESTEVPVYVKGLYYKVKGDLHEAYRCFKISTQLCPSFIPAFREMNLFLLEEKHKKETIDNIRRV